MTDLEAAKRAVAHEVSNDLTQLGQRFIRCTCGHIAQGGAYDTYAEQNFAYHQRENAS